MEYIQFDPNKSNGLVPPKGTGKAFLVPEGWATGVVVKLCASIQDSQVQILDLAIRLNNVKPLKCCLLAEAGSYLRLIDSCITQFKAQGPSRTCNESKEAASLGSGWVISQSGRPLSQKWPIRGTNSGKTLFQQLASSLVRVQVTARAFRLPWHEAVPPTHHDDQVDSDQ